MYQLRIKELKRNNKVKDNHNLCANVKYRGVVVIQSSGGLSKEQIEQMVNEAEQFAESDKKKKVLIQTRMGRGYGPNCMECTVHCYHLEYLTCRKYVCRCIYHMWKSIVGIKYWPTS